MHSPAYHQLFAGKYGDFFHENEIGTYNSINELGTKIENLKLNSKKINEYGKAGKNKYFKLFNNVKISKEIILLRNREVRF